MQSKGGLADTRRAKLPPRDPISDAVCEAVEQAETAADSLGKEAAFRVLVALLGRGGQVPEHMLCWKAFAHYNAGTWLKALPVLVQQKRRQMALS